MGKVVASLEKRNSPLWQVLLSLGGGAFVFLGILVLNRQYGFYSSVPNQFTASWTALHMLNTITQGVVPFLFLLAGYLNGEKRLSLARPVILWLTAVSSLMVGTALVFVSSKQLTLTAILSSVFPISQRVSLVLTGMLLALLFQPALLWLLEKGGQWLGWVVAVVVAALGSFLQIDPPHPGQYAILPLLVGLFWIGMVLRRSRWTAMRRWRSSALLAAVLGLTWTAQLLLASEGHGAGALVDRLSTPLGLPLLLVAGLTILFIMPSMTLTDASAVCRTLVIVFTLSQAAGIGQVIYGFFAEAFGSSMSDFTMVSIGLAVGLSIATWAWGLLAQRFLQRPAGWLTRHLAFTISGDFRDGWQSLRAVGRRFIAAQWPLLVLLGVFYLTVFGSFLAMSPGGRIMLDLEGASESVWQYLLTDGQTMIWYTLAFLFAAFFVLYVVTTRFWLSFILTESVYLIWTIANAIKMVYRSAPVTPADLDELRALPELVGMLGGGFVWVLLVILIALPIVGIVLLERRLPRKIRVAWPWRLAGVAAGALLLFSPLTINNPGSYSQVVNAAIGNTQNTITPQKGVQMSGPLLQFVNAVDVKVMDQPAGYSKARIQAIVAAYEKRAAVINKTRSTNIGDQNVIFNLSESFTDPTEFPNTKVSGSDPMPRIRSLMKTTTSGHMLSAGYGGGTANMEYESMTGLTMGNFAADIVPYSQVVPTDHDVISFNQNFAYGSAIHPYNGEFYNRIQVYQKMGLAKFSYLGSRYPITDKHKVQDNPYLSDQTAYANALKQLNARSGPQFIQLVTMQNHMPYDTSFYPKNPYKGHVSGTALSDKDTTGAMATFTYGVSRTDKAVDSFIKALDRLDKPVTVVFYGDHYPGILSGSYVSAQPIKMHATTYFIYSNKAARAGHKKILPAAKYVGTNDFIALVLAQLDAKVSPYEALLTDVQKKLPIMSMPPVTEKQADGQTMTRPDWVGKNGRKFSEDKMTAAQKRLYADYRLIQYDLAAGNEYALQSKTFTKNPGQAK
ncbi:sulfatase-like hydrolase/transferase [Schleiferilactobacillus shenzhenensis]|nr:sulfatase-like hydrolase/transferase [Schleiferilactobacillus shenzhenensis]